MRDRQPEQEANIALLIDADNASPDHLDDVLLVLGELGTINIRRAYGNWAKASIKGWGQLTGAHSIIPMQQFHVVTGQSATDIAEAALNALKWDVSIPKESIQVVVEKGNVTLTGTVDWQLQKQNAE